MPLASPDGTWAESGVYFVTASGGGMRSSSKLVLVRLRGRLGGAA